MKKKNNNKKKTRIKQIVMLGKLLLLFLSRDTSVFNMFKINV